MPYSFSHKKGGSLKTYDPGYKQAKKNWKGTAIYNKGALQKKYNYRKVSIAEAMAGRRKVTAVRGIYQSNSVAPSPLPRIAGKEVKYKDLDFYKNVVVDATSKLKYEENGFSPFSNTSWGITQDNTAHGRVGQKIFLKSLHMKFFAHFDEQDSDDASGYVAGNEPYRVLVVLDKQPNKALAYTTSVPNPASSEVMNVVDDTPSTPRATVFPVAFQRVATSKRFTILADKTYNMHGSDTLSVQNTTQSSMRVEEMIVPLSGITAIYAEDTTSGYIGTLVTNNVFVLFGFMNRSTGSRFDIYSIQFNTRLAWTD